MVRATEAEFSRTGKVLVTGAAGLVGANLVRRLLEDGYEVRAMVFPGANNRGVDGKMRASIPGGSEFVSTRDLTLAQAQQLLEHLREQGALEARFVKLADMLALRARRVRGPAPAR